MHAWGHTTDWRYGRGVPVHVPKKHMFDSGQSTIHGRGTPLTGGKVLGPRVGHSKEFYGRNSRESHGSLWGCALQRVSR